MLRASRILRSAIKQSADKSPVGGATVAAGDLARTQASSGDKHSHRPTGYPPSIWGTKYYELAGSGIDRPHAGWDKWKFDKDVVATLKRGEPSTKSDAAKGGKA
ncbi:hypothetical protein HDU88_001888 [Geranomyces variabilis]|nr:hypothetical protein HDU88_001888 [Geranomyces variabilis]